MAYILCLILVPIGIACLTQVFKSADPISSDQNWYGQPERGKKKASSSKERERELTCSR